MFVSLFIHTFIGSFIHAFIHSPNISQPGLKPSQPILRPNQPNLRPINPSINPKIMLMKNQSPKGIKSAVSLPYSSFLGSHGGKQGSGPNRGQSRVEWGDFVSVHSFPPRGHPARPDAQPTRPEAKPAGCVGCVAHISACI